VEERARIAREIHDGIAQDLVAIKMRSHYWRELIEWEPQKLNAEIDFLQNVVDNDIQEVRRSIFALRPLSLGKDGIFPSIKQYVKDFGDLNQITTKVVLSNEIPGLNEGLELSIFRIIQECLNNVAKHAKAKNVWISFKKISDISFRMVIRDNGIGFNVEEVRNMQHQGHFGLGQLQDRVCENHGKIKIASQPNKGVTIKIILPIREKLA